MGGGGWEPVILGGQEGYRRRKRKGREVGEVGGNLQQAIILQVKRGGSQECKVRKVRGLDARFPSTN